MAIPAARYDHPPLRNLISILIMNCLSAWELRELQELIDPDEH